MSSGEENQSELRGNTINAFLCGSFTLPKCVCVTTGYFSSSSIASDSGADGGFHLSEHLSATRTWFVLDWLTALDDLMWMCYGTRICSVKSVSFHEFMKAPFIGEYSTAIDVSEIICGTNNMGHIITQRQVKCCQLQINIITMCYGNAS